MDTPSSRAITLEKLYTLALDNGISFVSYRLPGNSEPVTMVQWLKNPAIINDIETLQLKSGFVFAPFDHNAGLPIRMIEPDLIVKGESFIRPEKVAHSQEQDATHKQEINVYSPNHNASKEEFISQVKQVQQIIAGHMIEKLVLSRINTEEKPDNFDPAMYFQALEKAYPDAFVFALYIPDTGLWFGASPEPLLLCNDGMVSTVSLAGTRTAQDIDLPWGEKEIDEQLIVTQYIDQILGKYNITNFDKMGPVSYTAGKVEHLKTTFSFPLKALQNNLAGFLQELHPTPSVCGLPKELSLHEIKKIEKHRREYYSGFLGPVNIDSDWNIYVNLRSMKTWDKVVEYFLGAGITKGSVAADEWEETINKMNTLKSIVESLKNN